MKRGVNRKLIEQIRGEQNKQRRDGLKKQLLWICFSGEFTKRNNESMKQHSGYICLDFDGIEAANLNMWRERIKSNVHTLALFTSPSGNGLKVIWKVPPCFTNDEHNRRFEAISKEFADCRYFDMNVKGWSRVCFESYDPDLYTNYEAQTFTGITEPVEIKRSTMPAPTGPATNASQVFDNIVKWFEQNHNMRKGNRNQGAFTFASGVADYLRRDEAEPMLTNYILSNVEQDPSDPFNGHECETCINQAYRNTPTPRKQMTFDYEDVPNVSNDFSEDEIEDEEIPEKYVFWDYTGRGAIKIDYMNLKVFLEANGFYKYRFNPEDISFIQVVQNIVRVVTVDNIRDFILSYLLELGENQPYNLFADTSKFKKEYIAFLDEKKPKFIKDTKTESWVFYRNTAVKVTAKGVELVSYLNLSGYIWERQMLDRDFTRGKYECDFSKFVLHLAAESVPRCQSILSGIGYMLHRYKNPSTVRALVLNEEEITNNPAGGTGKGVIFKAVEQLRVLIYVDGKSFDSKKSFVWQRVTPDTEVVVLDDVQRTFKFEDIFSILTTGWPVERKNKGEIFLDPSESPKIGIPTNYVLKGHSSSHNRRKFEIEIHPFYSDEYQPVDEFKKSFWLEWDEVEFNKFDNFMIECLRLFLEKGLIKVDFVNLEVKKFMAETSDEFFEFAKFHLENNKRYHRNETYEMFKSDNPGSYCKTANLFYDWMRAWGQYNKWEFTDCGQGRMYIEYGHPATTIQEDLKKREFDDVPF